MTRIYSLFYVYLFVDSFFISYNGVLSETGYFWHLTDVHLDLNYSVSGDPEQMCWYFGATPKDSESWLSEYGNPNCDVPITLMTSALSAMKEQSKRRGSEPDFIIWTGDSTAHVNDSFFTPSVVVGVIERVTEAIVNEFPNTLVLPALGNHDFYPKNQAPAGPNEVQSQLAELWSNWLKKFDAFDEFKKNGRYIVHLDYSNVSVLVLNTALYFEKNKLTADDPTADDPGHQFEWAKMQLRRLQEIGRKAFIVSHIPPGKDHESFIEDQNGYHSFQERYNRKYIDLIDKHWRTIAGQFFGHLHKDSFKVFIKEYSDSGLPEPISFALNAPAVSPIRFSGVGNNPAVRLIEYDRDTAQIKDVYQYYLDLENAIAKRKAHWKLEYRMTEQFNIETINATTLYKVSLNLKNDTFFDSNYPLNSVQRPNATASCSEQCRKSFVCAITEIDYAQFDKCSLALRIVQSPITIIVSLFIYVYLYA